ncbi:hypothetical protein [Desulfobacterium sp. N47]|uniref:Single cache domain-containing protein n=1 Tax=uncultured Desulfobacterium sp. TaxID=201089 RepID=E1YCM1_9BACT|nr:hypothetical protein N47_G36390 [uncultured Desulfobacterium sp.]
MQSQKYFRNATGFRVKIIVIVVAILSLSYSLGSFLSVLSFEKVYLKALTSKYEILSKDLKRKIETALKFGKRLDGFVGMENLVKPLYEQSRDISEIFLTDEKGNKLFYSAKAKFIIASGSTVSSEDNITIINRSIDTNEGLPVGKLFDWNAKDTIIREYNGKYYIMIPVIPPYGGNKGILGLTFSKSVIDEKEAVLIKAFRNKLILSILLTFLLVGLMIEFIFIRPESKLIAKTTEEIFDNPNLFKTASGEVSAEVEEIHRQISERLVHMQQSDKDIAANLYKLENLMSGNESAINEIRIMREIIDGK